MKKDLSRLDPTKKVFNLFEEFKAFAFKGNVIDLAVGEIKRQWVGIAESIMEHLEESLPPRNLVASPKYLDRQGHAVGSRSTRRVFGPCPAGGIGDRGAWPSFRSIV